MIQKKCTNVQADTCAHLTGKVTGRAKVSQMVPAAPIPSPSTYPCIRGVLGNGSFRKKREVTVLKGEREKRGREKVERGPEKGFKGVGTASFP